MAAPALNQYFIEDASRIQGEIDQIMRAQGRVSALMKKSVLPDGQGHNFSSVVTNRSKRSGGGWANVALTNGTGNSNCTPTPSTVSPSRTQFAYTARQTTVYSEDICFEDARAGYNFKQQVASDRENFKLEIVDTWEDEDKAQFITAAGHKIILNASRTESGYGQAIPNALAQSQITQAHLDLYYMQILQDGGGSEPYAHKSGAPLLPLICSMEASRAIQKGDSSIREDIRFAEQGKGDEARLLQNWSVDRAFGGFMHIIDVKMPRYDWVNGAYVERAYYANSATTVGSEAIVNPDYINAAFEVAFIWHPDVIHRQVPSPIGSVGADTSGKAWNFNGDVQWLNIADKDINPFNDIGFWAARLKAAYRPIKPRYGYVLLFKRCPGIATVNCPSY